MLPSIRRLKARREFLAVAATGQKWITPGLILQVRCRPPAKNGPAVSCFEEAGSGAGATAAEMAEAEEEAKRRPGELDIGLGFTVSRKVGNAVARNRARRRLKAAAELVLRQDGKPGRDYVLIGRKGTLDRAFDALIGDLREALRKAERRRAEGKSGDKRVKKTGAAPEDRSRAKGQSKETESSCPS